MSSSAAAQTVPTLYTYIESGNSYKVRLLAALLNIELEHKELDFLNDQQHSPEFLKINPRGEVPTLVDGDNTFTDSAAILTYLAGTHSDRDSTQTPSSFWSSDIVEQAKIVDWLAFAASWVQYGVFTARAILSFRGPYNGLGTATTPQALKEATIRGHKSLEILDLQLGKEKWLTLGRPTIADIAVFVYVALAPMGDISLEGYKNVKRWIEDIKKLEGFIPIKGLDDPLYRRRDR
jgi:glutathione S-transferase